MSPTHERWQICCDSRRVPVRLFYSFRLGRLPKEPCGTIVCQRVTSRLLHLELMAIRTWPLPLATNLATMRGKVTGENWGQFRRRGRVLCRAPTAQMREASALRSCIEKIGLSLARNTRGFEGLYEGFLPMLAFGVVCTSRKTKSCQSRCNCAHLAK